MQSHLGSVVLCLISTYAWLGSKFFGTFTRIVVKVYNLCRVKTNRLAVLTVKSGLDPHMINKLKDGYKSYSGYFLWPCWVPTISVLTLAYCCSEGEGVRSILKMMLSSRPTQPPVDCLWSWSLRFQDKLYNSDSLLFVVFSLFRDTVTDYSLIMSLYVWNLILAYI